MSIHSPLLIGVLGSLLVTSALGGIADAQGATLTVLVTSSSEEFSPQRVVIRAGDRVTWVNQDDQLHSLVSAGLASRQSAARPDEPFINTMLPRGSSFTQTFAQAGTYHYFCANHMQVWGVVVADE